MPKAHIIAIPIFPGLQSLDAVGPGQVFASVNQELQREAYRVCFVASKPGRISTSAGFALIADDLAKLPPRAVDTLVCPGGETEPVRTALLDKALMKWIAQTAKAAGRACSVCSGAFLLAATGLLNKRKAATHWSATENLQRAFPEIEVDEESIFVTDGKFWTSAGVTTGIDMALALVEEDHGQEIAMAVARRLVVYMRRPGHQTQFSTTLKAQSVVDDRFAKLATWIDANLNKPLSVENLAERVSMSKRTFHRLIRAELGVSPAKYVESIRLDAARRWLGNRSLGLAQIAARSGFSNPDHLIRAFNRRFGVTPATYRQIHLNPALETKAASA